MNMFRQISIYFLAVLFMSGCTITEAIQSEESEIIVSDVVEQESRLDIENFIGQRIKLAGQFPSELTKLNLTLVFPSKDQYKLLTKAKPSIEIYGEDGKLILRRVIEDDQSTYIINQKFEANKVFAKVGVYYCKLGDEGLCLIQNILYEINLSDTLQPGVINLEYELPGSYF